MGGFRIFLVLPPFGCDFGIEFDGALPFHFRHAGSTQPVIGGFEIVSRVRRCRGVRIKITGNIFRCFGRSSDLFFRLRRSEFNARFFLCGASLGKFRAHAGLGRRRGRLFGLVNRWGEGG